MRIIATIKVEKPKPRSRVFVDAVARGARSFRNRRRERQLKGWREEQS